LDFVSKRHLFFLLSLAVLLPGVVFLIYAPGLKPGIDFTGGSTISLEFADPIEQSDLRFGLADLGQADATVQRLSGASFFIRTRELDEVSKQALVDGLKSTLSPNGVQVLSFDLISPVVARETVYYAVWMVLAAAVLIFFFIWWAFRNLPSPFRYGAAAIIALIHDTGIVIGIFAILGVVMDMEVNNMFLFALLTIIGYSVNDTIVVFDRIRENVLMYPNRTLATNVNVSISESLGRSMNTSLTLLITVMALFLFGGSTIRPFLLVLIIGIVAGTYSSIAIASQIVVAWEYRDIPRLYRRLRPARSLGAE